MTLFAAAAVFFASSASADGPEKLVDGTPCTTAARACVDLTSQKAWLIKDGKVSRGPVPISSGGSGKETPLGDTFRVYNKDKDHMSQESRLPSGEPAPMPWSVFFADGGIALHAGDPKRASAGCVHLPPGDAEAFFNDLQIGDHVQVRKAEKKDSDKNDSTKKDSTKKDSDKKDSDKKDSTKKGSTKEGKDKKDSDKKKSAKKDSGKKESDKKGKDK